MRKILTLGAMSILALSCTRHDPILDLPPDDELDTHGKVFMNALQENSGWQQIWHMISEVAEPLPNHLLVTGNGDEWNYVIPLVHGDQIHGVAFFPEERYSIYDQFQWVGVGWEICGRSYVGKL